MKIVVVRGRSVSLLCLYRCDYIYIYKIYKTSFESDVKGLNFIALMWERTCPQLPAILGCYSAHLLTYP